MDRAEAHTGPALGLVRGVGRWLLGLPRYCSGGLALGWALGIWFLSGNEAQPGAPGPVFLVLANFAHAPLFGLLALWSLAALAPREGTWARLGGGAGLRIVLLVGTYGALDEWHQSFVPGRHPSALDVLTDVVGALCVGWIAMYAGRPDASNAGLLARLVVAFGACLLAAWVAVPGGATLPA